MAERQFEGGTMSPRARHFDPKEYFSNLDEVRLLEDGREITLRDLLNEELAQLSPLLREYIRYLEGR
jgi:hypothetical protein